MSNTPAPTAAVSQKSLACAASGLLMGQIVMGIAAFHGGSVFGLVLALVFVLSGGASIALFLNHLHVESRPRTERAPVQGWLLTLGAALLASIWVGRVL